MIRVFTIVAMLAFTSCGGLNPATINSTAETIARSQLHDVCQAFSDEATAIDGVIEETPIDQLNTASLHQFIAITEQATTRCERINETLSPGQDALMVEDKLKEMRGLEIVR